MLLLCADGHSVSYKGDNGMAGEVMSVIRGTRQRVPLYIALWRDDAVPGQIPEQGCTHDVLLSGGWGMGEE
jgi:hypothetical protein